ncbi:hypothetical protein FRC0411_00319 [Corynebacterium diphtheriae]|nr:hypothetical protein FRC0026_01481 [Corynebacterium diphtheriae]CAB0785083.1 hypothetical protein FRC0201_00128 [Corynebacterium diphtheriae]CAB0890471.1 hypothetical protein FRC0411_00319 [Corynebacterium diphtheriae]CAB0981945.1 hypothetical protein FRC0507_00174 [Corynebacterium diphtheriae]CAB0982827.1 hypothetical protein FRC0492_00261 [Corynebacterium diphtheriae]
MSREHYIDIFLDLDVGKTEHHALHTRPRRQQTL